MSVKSVCVRVCGVYAMKRMKCWTTPALMHVTEHTRLLNNEHAGNLYHYLFYTAPVAIAVKKPTATPTIKTHLAIIAFRILDTPNIIHCSSNPHYRLLTSSDTVTVVLQY